MSVVWAANELAVPAILAKECMAYHFHCMMIHLGSHTPTMNNLLCNILR